MSEQPARPRPSLLSRVRRRLAMQRQARKGAVSGLRSQWTAYPRKWRRDRSLNMDFETLGEEWGGPQFADAIVDDLVGTRIDRDSDVLELGCGGGKFSQRLAPRVRSLVCSDISRAMLNQTRGELELRGLADGVEFKQLNGIDFEGIPDDSVDFIFSYDVQLHLQPQNVFSYMLDAKRVLRPGGVFMVHQIDLNSSGGIDQFLMQHEAMTWNYALNSPWRTGHIYYMSRDQMEALADVAGVAELEIVEDFPGRDSELWPITGDRDIFGFMRYRPSRLDGLAEAGARLLQGENDETVWVVLADGTRAAIRSPLQFNRAGLSWDAIERVDAATLGGIPEVDSPLAAWE